MNRQKELTEPSLSYSSLPGLLSAEFELLGRESTDPIFFQVSTDHLMKPVFSDIEGVLMHQCKGSGTV